MGQRECQVFLSNKSELHFILYSISFSNLYISLLSLLSSALIQTLSYSLQYTQANKYILVTFVCIVPNSTIIVQFYFEEFTNKIIHPQCPSSQRGDGTSHQCDLQQEGLRSCKGPTKIANEIQSRRNNIKCFSMHYLEGRAFSFYNI